MASLSLSFVLVSIPVKLYSATEASAAVRFKLMRADGARVRQQYVSDEPIDDEPPEQEDLDAVKSASKCSGCRLLARGTVE